VIEALSSAQEAVTGMASSMKEFDAATNTANALAPLITGTDEAKDALHCAAFIMSQYPDADEDDKTTKVIGVASFNREADAMADLIAHIKEQFLRPVAVSRSNATQVRDAERISKINESQNKAATDILHMTTFVLLRSVDLTDKTVKTTPYLAVTCEEYADLIKRNAFRAARQSTKGSKRVLDKPKGTRHIYFNIGRSKCNGDSTQWQTVNSSRI
jgi:hypothetical protein